MATVLVVDDDEITRLMLGALLADEGHDVVYAGDGEAALERYRPGRFDLVITDLAMPRVNGLRLIQELRALDRTLPIIAMSGTNADQLDLAEDFGAETIVYKPLARDRVRGILERALQSQPSGTWNWAWG